MQPPPLLGWWEDESSRRTKAAAAGFNRDGFLLSLLGVAVDMTRAAVLTLVVEVFRAVESREALVHGDSLVPEHVLVDALLQKELVRGPVGTDQVCHRMHARSSESVQGVALCTVRVRSLTVVRAEGFFKFLDDAVVFLGATEEEIL